MTDDKFPTSFGGRFLNEMKTGANLEDIFLKARIGSKFQDFPMISTETGLLINDLVYKIITPYLIFNNNERTEFSSSYNAQDLASSLCKTDKQYAEIKRRIDEIANLASVPKMLFDTSKLEKALHAYREYQISFEKALTDSQASGDEVKSIIRRDYPDKYELFDKEDGVSILTVDRKDAIKMFKKELSGGKLNEWTKNAYQTSYNNLLIKDAIAKDVAKKISEKSQKKIKVFENIFRYSQKTESLAENVASEAKKLYDILYRNYSSKNSESNPCKDFIL
jgi:hypothetical protein